MDEGICGLFRWRSADEYPGPWYVLVEKLGRRFLVFMRSVTDVLLVIAVQALAWPGWLYEVDALAVVRES